MDRMDKVNALLKRELGQILQHDFEDQRMAFVSVTAVKTSKDLRNARVSISYFGDEKDLEHVLDSLNRASPFLRHQVGQKIRMRNTPALQFVYDSTLQYGARIEQTIEEIHQLEEGRGGKSSQDGS